VCEPRVLFGLGTHGAGTRGPDVSVSPVRALYFSIPRRENCLLLSPGLEVWEIGGVRKFVVNGARAWCPLADLFQSLLVVPPKLGLVEQSKYIVVRGRRWHTLEQWRFCDIEWLVQGFLWRIGRWWPAYWKHTRKQDYIVQDWFLLFYTEGNWQACSTRLADSLMDQVSCASDGVLALISPHESK